MAVSSSTIRDSAVALFDLERAWAELEAYVASKPSHGARDLLLRMAEVKASCAEGESLPERAFRLYGVQLHEDLRASARDAQEDPDPPSSPSRRSSPERMAALPGHRSLMAEEVDDDSSNREHAGVR